MGFVLIALNWHQMPLKSYLLLFIHKLILFALTTNAIIIFIMYLYMYLLKSLYLLEFIVVSTFIQLGIYLYYSKWYFLLYLLPLYLYAIFMYLLIFIGLDLISFYSIHVL